MSLASYGWTDRVAALAADHPNAMLGRVVRVDVDRCRVVTATGVSDVRSNPLPAVGDWVVLDEDAERVADVLPRWSALTRAGGTNTEVQILAANVDVVGIVVPLDRPVSLNRIERELVIAWDAPAVPLVVLSKADTSEDAESVAADVSRRCVGAEVIVTSVVDGRGLDLLRRAATPDRTVVLFGASGAGKSSLANALLGGDVFETGEVRSTDQRGRHTTAARYLQPLPTGGLLLDTPGLRALPLWSDAAGVETAFPDIGELAAECRFRDCQHETEPGCAVQAAARSGELDVARLASYQKLQREIAHLDRQQDPAARAAQTRKWKQIHKSMRHHPKR